MDIIEKISVLENYNKEKNKKEMMKLIRKAVTHLNNIKVISLSIELEIKFDNLDTYFQVTVYNNDKDNRTFYFYNFTNPKTNNKEFDSFIELVKNDSFKMILDSSRY